jgi:hypothetical protein
VVGGGIGGMKTTGRVGLALAAGLVAIGVRPLSAAVASPTLAITSPASGWVTSSATVSFSAPRRIR